MNFVLDADGKCTSCNQPALLAEMIRCSSCSKDFHAVCSAVTDRSDAICNQSFLKLFNTSTTKTNFKWFCDACLTTFEINKASTLDERFSVISHQITEMAKDFKAVTKECQELKSMVSNRNCCDHVSDTQGTTNTNSEGNSWSNVARTRNMKASLVIKNKNTSDSAGDALDLNVIKDIVVKNNIQVSKIGVSQKGNTFVHCPTKEDRDKLHPLLSAEVQNKEVVPLKDKSPHISITEVMNTTSGELTKASVIQEIRSQNPEVSALIDLGNEFNILFVRKDSHGKCNVVARVSCSIRDMIKTKGNKLFIGLSSCKVYDRFYIKRCNNCQEYGHYQGDCKNQAVCGYCGESHRSHTCSLKDGTDFGKHKCINCKKANLPHTGHSSFWSKCPSYNNAQNKLKATIQYYGKPPVGSNLNH